MENSDFILKFKNDSKYKYINYGCCQSIGNTFNNEEYSEVYEAIDLNDIPINLRTPEIIQKYISLVSEFIEVEYTPTNLDKSKIADLPADKNHIFFKIGKYRSNKHLVAAHTLVRYLWYDVHTEIVNAVLSLYSLYKQLEIEDIFAIAHSFQSHTNRGLLGVSVSNIDMLLYFRSKKECVKELAEGKSFNSIYLNPNIKIKPVITLKGDFFEDSESKINIKDFISFITSYSEENIENNISKDIFEKVIKTYLKFKETYYQIDTFIRTNNYTLTSAVILVEDLNLIEIQLEYHSPTASRETRKRIKDINELK